MSNSKKSAGGNGLIQLIVPALVGAAVSALAIALFVWFGPSQMRQAETPATAPEQAEETVSEAAEIDESRRAAIEKIIEEYLGNNPQILLRMSAALERQQEEERTARIQQTINSNADEIYRDNYGLETGNPDGDVTIVEFADYNCPYCKRAFGHLKKLLEKDDKVRVVLKEFPIFGERSEGAARVAIAASKQGKYFELHSALYQSRGRNNEKTALQIAEKLGLDMDKLREDMNSDETKNIIKKTRDLGNKLGIQGTPFFLVGDKVIPGAPDNLLEVFEENVAEIRKNGCTATC